MVASRRLKVKEGFYLKTGHFQNCSELRSSRHRSRSLEARRSRRMAPGGGLGPWGGGAPVLRQGQK